MEGNRETPGKEESRAAGIARLGGYFLGVVAALFLAAWVVILFMSRRDAPEAGAARAPEGGAVTRSAIENESPEGYIRVRLRVSALNEKGEYLPMGSEIRESVGLTMLGLDGKTYKAFFDKVGLWVVDMPAGTYEAPSGQPSLGKRAWTLSGKGVKSDGRGGYTLAIESGKEPPVLDLVLR